MSRIVAVEGVLADHRHTQQEITSTFMDVVLAGEPAGSSRRVLLERELLLQEVVWIGAGTTRHMAGLAPMDLLRLAGGMPVDLAESVEV